MAAERPPGAGRLLAFVRANAARAAASRPSPREVQKGWAPDARGTTAGIQPHVKEK